MAKRIYTRRGDDGTTGLISSARVYKDDPRVDAYGTVDELNAHLGVASVQIRLCGDFTSEDSEYWERIIHDIQHTLFEIGEELAVEQANPQKWEEKRQAQIKNLEALIDGLEAVTPPLYNFILPGGSSVGAQLHVARTVCRRAERRVISMAKSQPGFPESAPMHTIAYLNRLSDFLFVFARYLNNELNQNEVKHK